MIANMVMNMDDLLLFSEILLMGICVMLFILNIYTYRITANKKVLIVSCVFILFLLQAILVFISEFYSSLEFMKEPRTFMFIDFLVVAIIYGATMKK